MTVRELKAALAELPDDATLVYDVQDDGRDSFSRIEFHTDFMPLELDPARPDHARILKRGVTSAVMLTGI